MVTENVELHTNYSHINLITGGMCVFCFNTYHGKINEKLGLSLSGT